jgi:hypothetical protein
MRLRRSKFTRGSAGAISLAGVFLAGSLGDARFHGSLGNLRLAQPIVGAIATP